MQLAHAKAITDRTTLIELALQSNECPILVWCTLPISRGRNSQLTLALMTGTPGMLLLYNFATLSQKGEAIVHFSMHQSDLL